MRRMSSLPDPCPVLQDVVESYLLREIAARSDNFFEAAGVVQDLRGAVGRAYEDVKALRRTVWMLCLQEHHVLRCMVGVCS